MRKLVLLLLVTLILAPQGFALSGNRTQTATDLAVESILEEMTTEERVGQLFIITYQGNDVAQDSEIAQLIRQYHIGGIILRAENDNFTADEPMPQQIYELTRTLQSLTENSEDSATPVQQGPFIPLFIGLEDDGSGGINPEIQSGMSPLPSNMALGATWEPAYAEATGAILGEELAALGINLLIGPSADVVEEPHPSKTGDLATSEFGGDAYWVSKMAAAYVRGLHTGSNKRVAVFPRYFPGHGGADRIASVEIPSIQRTLDQLIQTDLKPFFAVTGGADDPLSQADGLLTGHIRYRGLQGENARIDTNPISLDPIYLPLLLDLEQISTWRAEGGLIMSDALGLRGIATQYAPDPNRQTPYRRIAQYALLAGNDLLYLGKFDPAMSIDETATIRDTITYLVAQYSQNPDIQPRVDEAVRRILRAKLDLYGSDTFNLSEVIPPQEELATVGTRTDITFTIAKQALTLLSPSHVANSPQDPDQIIIFTDSTTIRQCTNCAPRPVIPVDALRSQVLANYGPLATGDISFANIRSFSFDDLQRYYNQPQGTPNEEGTPQPNEVGVALDSADWVVFVMLNQPPDQTTSVVQRYLAETPAENTVVFAMGAPYYLDATEVSKLTAYYALYGTSAPFIEVAAAALFLRMNPQGSPPVSVNAIDYSILDATYPDPNLPISLFPECEVGEIPPSPSPFPLTLTPDLVASSIPCNPELGDTVILRTGIIRDRNGNPVPDGTPVQFYLNYDEQGQQLLGDQVTTSSGVAETRFRLEQPGTVVIRAISPPAILSDEIVFDISGEGVEFERVTPEPLPTTASPVTETEEAQEPAQITPTAIATPPPQDPNVKFGDLYLSLFGLLFFAGIVFAYGYRERDINYALLLALPVLVGGLLLYNYYAMLLPGTGKWRQIVNQRWAAALAAWVGGGLGLGMILFIMRGGMKWLRAMLARQRR